MMTSSGTLTGKLEGLRGVLRVLLVLGLLGVISSLWSFALGKKISKNKTTRNGSCDKD